MKFNYFNDEFFWLLSQYGNMSVLTNSRFRPKGDLITLLNV